MGFIFSTKKEKLVAIFDIGSGSIGGAMVRVPLDGKTIPKILKTVKNEIKIFEKFNFKRFIDEMSLTLNLTASHLYNKKIGAPDEIYCFLSSPWYISETNTIRMTKDKPFIFTKNLANELIEKEISKLIEIYKEKYSTTNGTAEIMEQHTTSVSLNGYIVNEPLGMKCQTLEMNMVISLSPQICLDKIRETLSKTFHHTKISFSSFTLATFFAIRDKYIDQDSYLLIDISGEITDIGIVTNGILKATLSFPFGKKTFFNYMCTKLEIELRDAKELFKLYNENNLSAEFKEKAIPLFKSIEKSWGESFDGCLNTLPHILVLPNTIFLTADNDIKDWFANVLRDENYTQSKISASSRRVITLDGPEFLNMCEVKEGNCDPFLMVESISVMRKIIK